MKKEKLKKLCTIKSGGTPSRKKKEYYGGHIPWVKISDITSSNGTIIETEEYITEAGLSDINNRIFNKGTLLFSMYGTLGETAVAGTKLSTNQAILGINPIDEKQLSSEYLRYWFKYKQRELDSLSRGVALKNLSATIVKDFEIPLPALSEQKAIVAKLDRAQRLIDIDREMLAKYDELIQSVFLEMFGDVESDKVSLSKLVKLNPRKSEISDIDKSMEASFLGMADVGENGSLNLSESQTIEESWKGYTYFKEDDVLFAKITPCMENGKGAIAKGLRNGLGFGSTEFHVLRPIDGVSRSAWIYHLTHSIKFRKIAESFMTGSAGQKRVPTHFFDRFKVVKPSIEKQIRFEEIATEISDDRKRLRSQIKKSEELFSSLVQGVFG